MSGDAANAGVRGAMGVGGMREGRVGGEERRRLVVERLRAAKSPVRGSDLAAEQGVSGDGDDQPAAYKDSPQPVEVLVTGQVGGLQRCADLRTHRSVIVGKG